LQKSAPFGCEHCALQPPESFAEQSAVQETFACAWHEPEQLAWHLPLQSGGLTLQLPSHFTPQLAWHEALQLAWSLVAEHSPSHFPSQSAVQ
jgi:hypothetical protein